MFGGVGRQINSPTVQAGWLHSPISRLIVG